MPHYISKTRHIFSDRYILISLHEFGVLIYKWQENITANITEILLSLSVICLMKKLE